MNKRAQVSVPSGQGGLIRYFENYASKIKIKPGHVIFFTVLTIIIVYVLQFLNPVGFPTAP
ncbi:MAG: preprotein translocase subunit Sec61beta [Candidatus Nanoarchaeia archaeon]|nr:preprotein translocase subunit Sec61beta [Candidatus Omnitrophota bacterium]MDD5417861.1 preprotein translocase subunit Sec61beta [Candidatus Nanoarchaeia archaeon]